jgi:hypothetical protein
MLTVTGLAPDGAFSVSRSDHFPKMSEPKYFTVSR